MKTPVLILLLILSFNVSATDSLSNKLPQQSQLANALYERKKIVLEFDNPEGLKTWMAKQEESFWLNNLPLIIAFSSLFGSIVLWYINEKHKQRIYIIKQKEERYVKMVLALKSFAQGSSNSALSQDFIDQLNLSWVYCPDEIIKKGTFLLETMITPSSGAKSFTNEEKVEAIGDLLLEIRKDVLSTNYTTKTKLSAKDYKSIGVK